MKTAKIKRAGHLLSLLLVYKINVINGQGRFLFQGLEICLFADRGMREMRDDERREVHNVKNRLMHWQQIYTTKERREVKDQN